MISKHREPTLGSVQSDLALCEPLCAIEDAIERLAFYVEKWGAHLEANEPEELELIRTAHRMLCVTDDVLNRKAVSLAPTKLARDHETWAELQAAEQEQAA